MSGLLAAVCGLLVAAALRELWAERGERARLLVGRRLRRLSARLPGLGPGSPLARASDGVADRLARAGIADRLAPRDLLVGRGACALAAVPLTLVLAPVAPGRLGLGVAVGLPIAAGAVPDLLVEQLGRRRRARIGARLPDSLELIAVGAGAGGNATSLLRTASEATSGPLREELAIAVAELECGERHARALARLGRRGGPELAGLGVLLERSRRLGSPLADGLQRQAVTLREEQARVIEERAARAAPKIQLVIALLFVPSVLLLVAAAIIANAEALLAGF
jgi:tight adherence protein C